MTLQVRANFDIAYERWSKEIGVIIITSTLRSTELNLIFKHCTDWIGDVHSRSVWNHVKLFSIQHVARFVLSLSDQILKNSCSWDGLEVLYSLVVILLQFPWDILRWLDWLGKLIRGSYNLIALRVTDIARVIFSRRRKLCSSLLHNGRKIARDAM